MENLKAMLQRLRDAGVSVAKREGHYLVQEVGRPSTIVVGVDELLGHLAVLDAQLEELTITGPADTLDEIAHVLGRECATVMVRAPRKA